MADVAPRDQNLVTCLLGTSSVDGISPVTLWADPTTHRLLTQPGSGSFAPADATYVVLSLNAGLSDERVLTGTANQVIITDNGAGSTVVLSLPQSIATSSTPSFASMTLTGASSLTLGTASTNAGSIILKNATNANTATILSGVTAASYSVTWPTAQGGASTFLQNNGSGVLSWASGGTGDVVGPGSATDEALVRFDGTTGKLVQNSNVTLTDAGILAPTANDGAFLGTGTASWGDLFLASGGVINWNNGDVTITHSADTLTIAGGSVVANDVSLTSGSALRTRLNAGNTMLIQARDVDGAAYTTFITLTANNTPTCTLDNVTSNTAFNPTSSDGAALGTSTLQWSDLFLAEGGVINFDNGDITITQTGNVLAVAGTSSVSFDGAITPAANDGSAIGTTALQWSDLFLASGAVLNFANGNSVITHSSAVLEVTTGDLRVTTAGTNSASVVTVGGTQTLTNKTLTSPTITTANLSGHQLFLENGAIQYDSALSADGKYCGFVRAGTAGTTLAFGDLVYLAAADSRWELTDADAASTSGDVLIAMCVLAAAADGDPTVLLMQGFIRADAAFPALTIGAPAYVSTTAGDIQTAQPSGTDDVIRRVGFAWTADELYFNPSNDYVTHT